jgi:hypothetical protein
MEGGRGHFRIKFSVHYFMPNHHKIAPNYSCLSFINTPLAERHDIPCKFLQENSFLWPLSGFAEKRIWV